MKDAARPSTHLEALLGLAAGLKPFSSGNSQAYLGIPAGESPQSWPFDFTGHFSEFFNA